MSAQFISWMNRKFWMLNIVILMFIAYFIASGVGTLFLSRLVTTLTPLNERAEIVRSVVHAKMAAPKFQNGFRDKMGEPLLRRNIFDSKTGPIDRDAANRTEVAVAEDFEIAALALCDNIGIQVNSTVADQYDPEWSFVSLQDNGRRKLLRIGDKLNEKEVAWISWRYLFLQDESAVCYIDLFGAENRVNPSKPKGRGPGAPSFLKRGEVNKLLQNPIRFTKATRIRPHQKNGKLIGYEIKRVPRRGTLSRLGLKKKDVVRKINGVPITGMDKLADAYEKIKKANSLRFSVTRKGKPVEINIKIK